ncbi:MULTISPECIES: hypothetical protein [unclassified Lysinibacillus]|uniref:hypothetical protein n=1 Tax=unclassified Lysinibacillus TaxID=2636778 RepID=UPI00255699ED|nr:hypothetical protein [Lysinibacillus sp. fls2-241-R2A-57]
MKNTLGDLNNHLFAQLERLSDEDLVGNKLTEEIERAKAVTSVANQIISNGSLVLQAQKFYDNPDRLNLDAEKPKLLKG